MTDTATALTTLTVIRGATEYDLSDGVLGWRIEENGLGMAAVRHITERGPQQHGETDVGFRLEPRSIQLIFGMYPGPGGTEADYYDLRDQLLRIFRPWTSPISLRYALPNGATRQIDCHYAGDMAFASQDRSGYFQRVGVQLRAADPTFYDPTQASLAFNLGVTTDTTTPTASGFVIPLVIPFAVGSASGGGGGSVTIAQTRTISYLGSWRTYPFLRIKGPITSPVITNETTGDTLDFTGTTIASGAYYDIDCRYGYKTVTDSSGVNRIAALSSDSDLATFSFEPDPEAPSGDNVLAVSGSDVSATTEVYVTWSVRYIGI